MKEKLQETAYIWFCVDSVHKRIGTLSALALYIYISLKRDWKFIKVQVLEWGVEELSFDF